MSSIYLVWFSVFCIFSLYPFTSARSPDWMQVQIRPPVLAIRPVGKPRRTQPAGTRIRLVPLSMDLSGESLG